METQQTFVNVGFRSSTQPTQFHGFALNRQVLASVGDLVTVEDSHKQFGQSRWYRVTFSNNVNGWVREDLLSIWPKGCVITCPEY